MRKEAEARIAVIAEQISKLKEEIRARTETACALHQHGRANAERLGEQYSAPLQDTSNQLRETLKAYPVSSVVGWEDEAWYSWNPATAREEAFIRVGEFIEERAKGSYVVPALVPFIGAHPTLVIRGRGRSNEAAVALLQALLVRTAVMFPHQVSYSLLDPAGNGIAFPMGRHLPDVTSSTGDLRRDLDSITRDIQRIIRQYLDASVTSFEKVSPEIRVAEKYHFVFAADFPNRYDRRAIEALQSISSTGPRAGVYVFVHQNRDHDLPRDITMEGFENAVYIDPQPATHTVGKLPMVFRSEPAPSADAQNRIFATLKSARPPEKILDWDAFVGIPEEQWWQEDSAGIIRSPIGVKGAGEQLDLWFGVGDSSRPCAHGMLGGMTGAGKSYLYHTVICGLATRYSPKELRFYLVDGKDGVELQAYRRLPHAEVVSLRSSSELSRSVVAELVAEKERRNALFARAGVSDLTSYRDKGAPLGNLPRILLLIDEYQELFEGDKEGKASGQLLQLSEQGRSVGIHMLLGSQRFGAAGMLHQKAIFGNTHLLMAMQMKAEDIQSLTEFGRNGKSLIARCDLPGKIVVNDQGGEDNANVAGKVAYLSPERREQLVEKLAEKARGLDDRELPQRVVFDGKAQPSLAENPLFDDLLQQADWPTPEALEELARRPYSDGGLGVADWFQAEQPFIAWVGQQFNVRGQTALVVRRRTSENAVLLGGANTARYGMLASMLMSLSINQPPHRAQFVVLDRSIAGSEWNGVLHKVCSNLLVPSGFEVMFSDSSIQARVHMEALIQDLERRQGLREADLMNSPSMFVMMTELDRMQEFLQTLGAYGRTELSPLGNKLQRLVVEGPPVGIHFILSFSGFPPMAHVIDARHGLFHFRHRIATQMSEDHSYSFMRSNTASQLQLDGSLPVCAAYADLENDRRVRFKPYSTDDGGTEGVSLIEFINVIRQILSRRRV